MAWFKVFVGIRQFCDKIDHEPLLSIAQSSRGLDTAHGAAGIAYFPRFFDHPRY